MVHAEEVTPEEGVVLLLAEDENGNIVPTGRYMRWLAGQILDKPTRPKGKNNASILKK